MVNRNLPLTLFFGLLVLASRVRGGGTGQPTVANS